MTYWKTIFHVHTDYSDDSDHSVADILAACRTHGVNAITITDHDTIDGARALADAVPADLKVVVGEEISTARGHLIGLFLHEHIPPGMSPRDTALAIRDQGGLVVVPHPFNRLFGCGLNDAVHDILDLIDLVEAFNAQNLLGGPNQRAEQFAHDHGRPTLSGADAHFRGSLGPCHQWMVPFRGPRDFVESARRSHQVRVRHRLSYFIQAGWLTFSYRVLGLAAPARYGAHCTTSRGRVQPATITA